MTLDHWHNAKPGKGLLRIIYFVLHHILMLYLSQIVPWVRMGIHITLMPGPANPTHGNVSHSIGSCL